MISFKDWKNLDIKVGKILSVEDHPNADKLYVMKIDIGDEVKNIVAGIREHYKKKDLINKKIVVFCNLEPATLRGIKSEGMILAAVKRENNKEEKVVLLIPDKDIDIGARIE